MSKHISKLSKGPNRPSANKKQHGNNRRIGESTAKRMQAKLKQPKDFDEEIDSDMAEDIDEQEVKTAKVGKSLQDDPFFQADEEMEKNETLEERRLRMTKKLLEEL